MEDYEENIPLTKEDLEKIRKILKEHKFEDFKIHPYYFRDKFTGAIGKEPRHGISLQELKSIYYKFDIITRGFKRKGKKGYKYTLCYQESKNVHVRIGFFFDEKPMQIFNAIRIYRNLEKAVPKRYGIGI